MKNWQTTIAGVCLTVGTMIMNSGNEGMLHYAGMVLAGIGGLWLGFAASDAKKM